MILGVLLILAGVLIAVYPALLSIIVASMLIFFGIVFVSLSLHYKKMTREFKDPFFKFFFRF